MFQPNERVVAVDPEVSRRLVNGFCAFTATEPREHFSRDEVVELLRGVGFAVVPDTLREFTAKGYCTEPPSGRWEAIHVHALAAALDSRRRWLPGPNQLHDAKKSPTRRDLELAKAAGVPVFTDLEKFTLEDMLITLAECDNRMQREFVYEAVRAKLEALGCVEE